MLKMDPSGFRGEGKIVIGDTIELLGRRKYSQLYRIPLLIIGFWIIFWVSHYFLLRDNISFGGNSETTADFVMNTTIFLTVLFAIPLYIVVQNLTTKFLLRLRQQDIVEIRREDRKITLKNSQGEILFTALNEEDARAIELVKERISTDSSNEPPPPTKRKWSSVQTENIILIFISMLSLFGLPSLFSAIEHNILSGFYSEKGLLPANWSVEEMQTKGNEALLFSNGETIIEYKRKQGFYPENLESILADDFLNKDVSGKSARYMLSADKTSFDLRFAGHDGEFDTNDDIVFDPSRLVNNLLPMYGGENMVRTPRVFQADKKFFDSLPETYSYRREEISAEFIKLARKYLEERDVDTAMRRFNQAWLIDPNNSESYKGFAEILRMQGKMDEADKMLKIAQEKETTINPSI